MKYRYALKENGEKIDILELTKDSCTTREHFICIGCRRILIPVLGTRREKHFRHRPADEVVCSHETYLHALAKKRIVEAFLIAIGSHKPYILRLPVERYCTRWKDELG